MQSHYNGRVSRPPYQHRARKRFGQNFLCDASVVDRIAAAIAPRAGEHLVEIGPGQGALTAPLAASGCRLDVVELDRDLAAGLLAAFGLRPQFRLHSADALAFDFAGLAGPQERLRVVGNLPYNISTPLLVRLLQHTAIIHDMHFMLQKEVVERLAATPGGKQWGRLGILAQYHCQVESLFDVPPSAFSPRPQVQSAVVRLVPWTESPWPPCDPAQLGRLAQAAFAQRRKTLRNNLKGLIDSAALEALGIDPGARAETLDMKQLIALANTSHGPT